MKTDYWITLSLFSLIIFLSCGTVKEDYQPLFVEGSDDWFKSGQSQWAFEDNELSGLAQTDGGFVMTRSLYKDFIIELDFFPGEKVNSGVFVRCQEQELSATECYEINIWDDHPKQEWRTGAVVSRSSPLTTVSTLNQWNTYKIRCVKTRIEAWINDTKVTDITDDSLSEGYIALQSAGEGKIRFRDIRLKMLTEESSNP